MPIISFSEIPGSIVIPYGETDHYSLYVCDPNGDYETNYSEILWDFSVTVRLNQMPTFDIKLMGVTEDDQPFLQKGKIIKLFSNNKLILKGKIEKANFDSYREGSLTGFGMAVSLRDTKLTGENSYILEANSYLIRRLCTTDMLGVAPDIMQVGINEDYGKITIDFKYEGRLKGVERVADISRFEWYVDQKASEAYNTDYLNVTSQAGSAASVYTFSISGDDSNAKRVTNEQDDEIYNYVSVIGNSGVTSIWRHATTNRTFINNADGVTADAATIVVDSTTGFEATGTLMIGVEQVTYTGVTATAFTGCTRGANSTTAYAHSDNIEVSDYAYNESAAQGGSSIGDNGIKPKTFIERSITDQDTADRQAQQFGLDNQAVKHNVVIYPCDPKGAYDNFNLGDMITVVDSTAGLSTDYRVIGFEWSQSSGEESLKLEVNTRRKAIVDKVKDISVLSDNVGTYV